MDLKMINKVGRMSGVLPTKPLSNVTSKKNYVIYRIRKVPTKYDIRILAELEKQFAVFLLTKIMEIFDILTVKIHLKRWKKRLR